MIASQLTQIDKKILIRAPCERVWRAITNVDEFNTWFSVKMSGAFTPGARLEMISTHPSSEGIVVRMEIVEMIPPKRFSWRWHPGMPDPTVDYSTEPMTLVTFELEDAEGGTLLKLTESGFDQITLARRAGIYDQNDKGWKEQLASLERYL